MARARVAARSSGPWPSPSPKPARTRRHHRPGPGEGGWVVSGAETFITNGASAILRGRGVGPAASPRLAVPLVVEPGNSRRSPRTLEKVGWRTSPAGELAFNAAPSPRENLSASSKGGSS